MDLKMAGLYQSLVPNDSISLDLKDYKDILDWINDYNSIRLTPVEIEAYIGQWGKEKCWTKRQVVDVNKPL